MGVWRRKLPDDGVIYINCGTKRHSPVDIPLNGEGKVC